MTNPSHYWASQRLFFKYHNPPNRTAEMSSTSKYTLPDGRNVDYKLSTPQTGGGDSAQLVLLSNSLTAPFPVWDHIAQALLEQGYGVLQYDQPGHGGSSAPSDLNSTTFESLADDVASLLSGLKIDKVNAWIGVSMGAATGVYFVVRHPGIVRNLVICDTISSSPKVARVNDLFGPRADTAQKKGNMDSMVDATFDRWFSQEWQKSHPQEVERVRGIMSTTTVDGFVTCIRALQSETFDLKPLVSKIGGVCDNAMLLVGELDADLPKSMDELRRRVEEGFQSAGKASTVELKVIKGAGHVSYVDGFDEFWTVVKQFLDHCNQRA